MTCQHCNQPITEPRYDCPLCGYWSGGWSEKACLAAMCAAPAVWLLSYVAALGFIG